MSREWQQRRQREYLMPDEVYYQTLWAVRDLSRMERSLTIREDMQPYKVSDKEKVQARIDSIKDALNVVPENYRGYVLDNIQLRNPGTDYPNNLWKIWKQRFLFHVAQNLDLM